MMILRREYMVLCYPYLVPASVAPVDTSVRGLCTWIAERIEISVLVLLQVIGVFVKRHMPPRFAICGDDLFETDSVTHESAQPYLYFSVALSGISFLLWRCNALFHRDRLVCHGAAGRGVSFRQLFACIFQFFRCRWLYCFFFGNHLCTPLASNLDG